jgi:transposase
MPSTAREPIKDFLAAGGAQRLHLERLPGYAPELNADEGIWQYLKRVELKNVVCQDLDELRYELRLATRGCGTSVRSSKAVSVTRDWFFRSLCPGQ